MSDIPKFRLDWATPLLPAFDSATLAARLGHVDRDACSAEKQGRCPGHRLCADCAWSEGPFREAR